MGGIDAILSGCRAGRNNLMTIAGDPQTDTCCISCRITFGTVKSAKQQDVAVVFPGVLLINCKKICVFFRSIIEKTQKPVYIACKNKHVF